MRNCFVCETPYQVFNCINMVMSDMFGINSTYDIYIGDSFSSYKKLATALVQENVFDHVYSYSYKKAKHNPIVRLQLMMSPFKYVKHIVDGAIDDLQSYDNVYVSNLSNMAITMILGSPIAKVCFYDDGIGSYISDIGMYLITPIKKRVMKILGIEMSRFTPEVLYLNNPDMFIQGWSAEKRKLPRPDIRNTEYMRILNNVFGNIPDCYDTNKPVFLTQPIVTPDQELRKKQELSKLELLSYLSSDSVIIRMHPSDSPDVYINRGFDVDDSQVLWELICSTKIHDESILIGSSSTALFSPKLLYNKEPTLIILSRLQESVSNLHMVNQLLEVLKERYAEPNKIIYIDTYDQLHNILASYDQHF